MTEIAQEKFALKLSFSIPAMAEIMQRFGYCAYLAQHIEMFMLSIICAKESQVSERSFDELARARADLSFSSRIKKIRTLYKNEDLDLSVFEKLKWYRNTLAHDVFCVNPFFLDVDQNLKGVRGFFADCQGMFESGFDLTLGLAIAESKRAAIPAEIGTLKLKWGEKELLRHAMSALAD